MTETTTKEATPVVNPAVVDQAAATLVKGEVQLDANTLVRITWTRERIQLMKRTIIPSACSDDEFAIFLEQCRRSQMDPLMYEADCVPRRTKVKHADGSEEYVLHHVFQVREQGMEARADRFADFEGITGAVVHEKDDFMFDAVEQKIAHRYDVTKPRGKMIGAWARGKRRGRDAVLEFLPFDERAQKYPSGGLVDTWAKMPGTMIAKCARFAVLKRLYPNTFNGLTIDAEANWEELEVNAAPGEGDGGETGVAGVNEKLKKKRSAAGSSTVDAPKVATVPFKNHKLFGKPLVELLDPQLHEVIKYGTDTLAKWNEKWGDAKPWEADIDLVRAHLNERHKARGATPPAATTPSSSAPPAGPPAATEEPGSAG